MQDFKRLAVWSVSMDLAQSVYETTANFPPGERYELTKQMRRCSVSIPSNIAEGCGRTTRRELAYFVGVAIGSAHELETQVLLATRLGLIASNDRLLTQVHRAKAMLLRFHRSVREQLGDP